MGEVVWYSDDDIVIKFDKVPDVDIRIIEPTMTDEEIKAIYKKPFICKSELKVVIIDKEEPMQYDFTIPKGYCWDGASIPTSVWFLIGSKTEPKFLIPSLIHDVLCENHDYVDDDRYLSTIVLERLCRVSKVLGVNRWAIKHSVDNFQKVFGGW